MSGDKGAGAGKRILTTAEAAQLLRDLAAQLEHGSLEVGGKPPMPGEEFKVKVRSKCNDRRASLSLKLQWSAAPDAVESEPEDGIPSYKSIKKRINASFKNIKARLDEGQLPDLQLAELFDGDAELMLEYPDKGEAADITAFRELSASFLGAVEAGDLVKVQGAVAAMAAAEKSCHKRYK